MVGSRKVGAYFFRNFLYIQSSTPKPLGVRKTCIEEYPHRGSNVPTVLQYGQMNAPTILAIGIEECPSCAHIADSVSHWNRCHNCPHSIDIKGCTNCPHTVENVPQLFSPKIMLEDSWSIPLCPRLTDPVLTLYINCP